MKLLICVAAVLFLTPACSNRPPDDAQQQSHTAVAQQSAAAPAPLEEQPAAQTPPADQQPKAHKKPQPEPGPVGTTHAVVDGKVVNVDAQTLKDFKDRVDKYVDVHKKAEREAPPLKETNEPAKIKVAENALAAEIREQRAGAKPGDIF